MIDESFLTTEEVLEYLQVNLRTVYRLIKAGKIPAVRVGRQWRFRKRDIDAWLESQRPRGGARASSPAPARQPAAGGGRPRVLVVDDEATIRDTGPGIAPDVLPRIFDPFFTTKEVGQGTGLGLAITYGIVSEHGGAITASSAEDGGAVFQIELPAAAVGGKVNTGRAHS